MFILGNFLIALLSSTKTPLVAAISSRLTNLKEELAKAAPEREERASKVMNSDPHGGDQLSISNPKHESRGI